MATGLLESMDYKGGGLLERTHCTDFLILAFRIFLVCTCSQYHKKKELNLSIYHLEYSKAHFAVFSVILLDLNPV